MGKILCYIKNNMADYELTFPSNILRKIGDNEFISIAYTKEQVTAKSGILGNHKYTTSLVEDYFKEHNIQDCFSRQNYIETKVVCDGNLITAKGNAFIDFGIEILDYYKLYKNEDEKKKDTAYFKALN